jgi:glycosyltransferase involved in cell wall biosynthesis
VTMSEARVAIVHDWLVSMRGAENVLESLCRIYPRADVYTLRYDSRNLSPEITSHRVTASFLDRLARTLPLGRAGFRMLLPLFPAAIESFRLDEYDLVISSSHAVAKGARPRAGALCVSYVHSPMRYVWEAEGDYTTHVPGGAIGRAAFGLVARRLRRWDKAVTHRAVALAANSTYTQERIQRYYGRDAIVIEPPVDTRRFARIPDPTGVRASDGPTYLCVSALVPYKRVELAVRAMTGRRGRLFVVGEGPDRDRLARLAPSNVELLGRVDDAEVDRLFARCDGVIHPAIDDFGIVPVEALAAGRPVVAFAEGGTVDSIRDGEGGALFREATPASLAAALDALERRSFAPAALRALARRFDRVEFERRFGAWVEEAWRARAEQRP